MLISKKVYSPAGRLPGNTLDRTPGFYGHLPKFWNCREYHWGASIYEDIMHPDTLLEMKIEHEYQKHLHSKCKIPWHLSYNGYIAFVFPNKGRLVWNYFGRSPNPNHGRIVWQPGFRRKMEDFEWGEF